MSRSIQVEALYLCIPTQKFLNMADLHSQMSMFWNLIFYLINWIESCDKRNLTFVDCWDNILLKLVLGKKRSLKNIFQDSFYKILSQQLTYDRSYISQAPITD